MHSIPHRIGSFSLLTFVLGTALPPVLTPAVVAQTPPGDSEPIESASQREPQADRPAQGSRPNGEGLQADPAAPQNIGGFPTQVGAMESSMEELRRASALINYLAALMTAVSLFLALLSFLIGLVSLLLGVAAFLGWKAISSAATAKVEAAALQHEKRLAALEAELGKRFDVQRAEAIETLRSEGSQLQEQLKDQRKGFEKDLDALEEELVARTKNAAALVLGRLSRHRDDFLEVDRHDLLDLAIGFAREAVEVLEKRQSPARWRAMNNLAFYYALKREPGLAGEALRLAEQLRQLHLERGTEHPYLATYIRVVGQYAPASADPATALRQAEEAVRLLLDDSSTPQRERTEVEQYAPWLQARKEAWITGGWKLEIDVGG